MAGSTPIYGFPYPESSDLVANYPALGQDLAEDIESVISGISSGLNHVNTTTFTTQSTVSLNTVFSATYDYYRILMNISHSTSTNLRMRLRLSGTDATTNYYSKLIYSAYSATTVNGDAVINNGNNLWIGMGSTEKGISMDIYNPFIATPTRISNITGDSAHGAAGGAYHNASTAYDGFTIYPDTGTITGTVRVFGYQNS